MITLFRTSDAARYLGISNNYLKNLRESHGGFLKEGEDYFLGVSVTDSIRWNVDKIRKKCTIKVGSLDMAEKCQIN